MNAILLALMVGAAAEPAGALGDLVLATGPRQLRVRVAVTHNGLPWNEHFAASQRRHLQSLFIQLDANGDGRLSSDEAKRLPPPRLLGQPQKQTEVFVAFNFRVLDDNGDDGVTLEELAAYLSGINRVPLTMVSADRKRVGSEDLFTLLDADGDGRLVPAEWTNIAPLLARDRDGNRVLADDELRPTTAVFGPEFVATAIGQTKATLNVTLEPPAAKSPDAVLSIRYVDENAGDAERAAAPPTASLQWTTDPPLPKEILDIVHAEPNQLMLMYRGQRVELRLLPASFRRTNQVQQAILRQYEAVQDSVGENPKAGQLPPLLKDVYAVADGNADGKLEPDELRRCLDGLVAARLSAEAAQLRLIVQGQRRGLGSLVDTNFDGRISRRELSSLGPVLQSFLGERQSLAREDLPATISVVVQRGPFDVADASTFLETGPPWFFRADTNRDGDLDAGEFLGPPELFRRLDRNGDGWLDVQEAIGADHQLSAVTTREVTP